MTKKYINGLTYKVVGAAIEVHKAIGPGLLESVYHKCLKQELMLRTISFQSELIIPIKYKGFELEADLRCDLLIENSLVVELKAVDTVIPVYEAQILSYMKLLNVPKGILMNFNCGNLYKEGLRTYVNELFKALPQE